MPDKQEDEELFVRVEGYKDILQDLEAIKQIIENAREAVEVMNQVDRVKEKSIQTFMENIQRLNSKLDEVDSQLPKMKETPVPEKTPEPKETPQKSPSKNIEQEEMIDESIKDLHTELKGLKDELDKLQ